MGMQSYETRGYGIQFDHRCGTNTTPDKIRKLLEFAPEFRKEVTEQLEDWDVKYEEATVDDFAEIEQDYYTGIPFIIAKVMNERYGCDFMEALSDENSRLYLVMCKCMPWQMSDFEKQLTEEQLADMIREHYNVLYEEDADIGDVSVYDFG